MRKKGPARGTAETCVRAHVWYSGRVQGVGFRYTAERLALERSLCGWVMNLPDGRVEMVCEGPRPRVQELLEAVRKSQLGPHIRKEDLRWEKASGEFGDFTVEFCC